MTSSQPPFTITGMDGNKTDNFEPAPFLWIEEGKGQASAPKTRKRVKKKREFVGWGSRELIDFLKSIGKDTTNALSQHDVSNVINQYVVEKKLINPDKKKRVVCDDNLFSIFGKKSIFKNKMHDLLESHLAENQVDSDDDDDFGSLDEKDVGGLPESKKQKFSNSDKKLPLKKKAPEVPKSWLAAINSENIKLVYLKKSLVLELLNNPELFESKVVGSFVRVKADPYDLFQKNSHEIQIVRGVTEVAPAGDSSSTRLLVSGMISGDIPVSELSDQNFSENEIEDLHRRMKEGLLKQPTIGELEQKVAVLHEDITKHWLARELKLLKNRIDHANEKGLRYEMGEYLGRRKLLQSPDEVSRILSEIPKVMPEEVKPETTSDCTPDDSPKTADWDWEPCDFSSTVGVMTKPEVLNKQNGQAAAEISTRSNGDTHPFSPRERIRPGTVPLEAVNNGIAQSLEPKDRVTVKAEGNGVEINGHMKFLNHVGALNIEIRQESNGHIQLPSLKQSEGTRVEVIDLSDEEDQKTQVGGTQIPLPHAEQLMWHYFDPQNRVQGPFSLTSLKRWNDLSYFPSGFKVWLSGRSPQEAIPLSNILQQNFPN